jgi:hypothetical protein
VLPIICVITLLWPAFAALFVLRRSGGGEKKAATPRYRLSKRRAPSGLITLAGEESPWSSLWLQTGDDLFDDSFSIDSPSGKFLGECGVGISETIGVGDPKKVTAFESGCSIKTTSGRHQGLMSAHAFMDDRPASGWSPGRTSPGGAGTRLC